MVSARGTCAVKKTLVGGRKDRSPKKGRAVPRYPRLRISLFDLLRGFSPPGQTSGVGRKNRVCPTPRWPVRVTVA